MVSRESQCAGPGSNCVFYSLSHGDLKDNFVGVRFGSPRIQGLAAISPEMELLSVALHVD